MIGHFAQRIFKILTAFFTRPLVCGLLYSALLFLISYRVCLALPHTYAAYMNSMHGFWMALAKGSQGGWFHPVWWPYWDCGMPFEFTYAPLVPASMAMLSAFGGMPPDAAFRFVAVAVYCLAPVLLFLAVWGLTRSAGYSFLAALIYSLSSPSQLFVPDADPSINTVWSARRLYLSTVWDDTPHLAALAFLPLAILFLYLSLRRTRSLHLIPAILAIAIMAFSSVFGAVLAALAGLCLLAALPRREIARNGLIVAGAGVFAYAIVCPFLPPSLFQAMRQASALREDHWGPGTLPAAAIAISGALLLWHYLPRWTTQVPLRFFALFAYCVSVVPLFDSYLHCQILPQPGRYKVEMDLALSVLFVFALRPWFARLPLIVRAGLLAAGLALVPGQIGRHRTSAGAFHPPRDAAQTVEYRAAAWAAQNLPGVRVMFPGSVAQWANDFTNVSQFSGESWSQAYNPVQQVGLVAQYRAGATAQESARISLVWLQAFGVGAVGISAPDSAEFWKGFVNPARFEGVLPVLWRGDGVTLYRVPRITSSLAHVMPDGSIVRRTPANAADVAPLSAFVAALDDPSLPPASLEWQGRNLMNIRTNARPGQDISLQVSYHPGWHAQVNGRGVKLQRDALGLMWLAPACDGPCAVRLSYDGGWPLRMLHYLSFAALAVLVLWTLWAAATHRRSSAPAHPQPR